MNKPKFRIGEQIRIVSINNVMEKLRCHAEDIYWGHLCGKMYTITDIYNISNTIVYMLDTKDISYNQFCEDWLQSIVKEKLEML